MKGKLAVWFLILPVLAITANAAHAGPHIYIGIGMHTTSFGKDLKPGKYVSIMPGPGVALNLGVNFSSKLKLDFRAGRTFQREKISKSTVNCDWIEAGPLYYLVPQRKFRPFVSAGVGSYKLETTGLDFEGTGIFASVGVEEVINIYHSAKFYLQGTSWKDDEFDLNVEALNFGVIYNYTF